ncbi:hypothetical protein EI74_0307 [Mycoplasma testudineum]|uniref:Uncharacterized protein n=1 Tax=Mycoplasma testudineum TaxID=244584 RepID=A0A4R6IFQ7_9MOLU|nr:hypothetical protein [Mycoplasma testudineum]OYD26928.1 hypothetical protein CG473_01145 [Mycoplasma testudineum]TDO20477.1 hypothetical protein EI74_0307 [Mycoplasma testudineum]
MNKKIKLFIGLPIAAIGVGVAAISCTYAISTSNEALVKNEITRLSNLSAQNRTSSNDAITSSESSSVTYKDNITKLAQDFPGFKFDTEKFKYTVKSETNPNKISKVIVLTVSLIKDSSISFDTANITLSGFLSANY